MQVTVESTGTLGRRMKVALPADRLEQEFASRLKKLSQRVKVPGFRPGKVPAKVVEAQYGRELLEEATQELIQKSFYEAVTAEKLRPAGGPQIEPKTAVRGSALEYIAEFEIYPDVKKRDLAGIVVEKPVVEVSEADIDQTLETMRLQRKQWHDAADRVAATGDRLTVSFVGRVEGQVFPGGEADDFPLVLGEGQLIPGFEDGLLGAAAGQTRTVSVTFPADYHANALAGKPAEFEVRVAKVEEAQLPAIDGEFAKSVGVEDGRVETLRRDVREALEKEAAKRVRGLVKERVFKAILEANPGELPKALVEEEAHELLHQAMEHLGQRGIAKGKLPHDTAPFVDRARTRVGLGIIVGEIIREQQLRVDSARVRHRLEEMAASYDSPQEFVDWHYARPERLREIESVLLEDQVAEFLLKTADVREQATQFRDMPAP